MTAPAHVYITGDARLYKKALLDFADSTFICKGMMAVAPAGFMQEIADFSLLYPLQLLNYYHLTGDAETVLALLPAAEGMVRHFQQYRRADGLLESVTDKWNLVDWPDNLRDGYDFPLTKPPAKGCHNVINAYYYGALCSLNALYGALNIPKHEDAASAEGGILRRLLPCGARAVCRCRAVCTLFPARQRAAAVLRHDRAGARQAGG